MREKSGRTNHASVTGIRGETTHIRTRSNGQTNVPSQINTTMCNTNNRKPPMRTRMRRMTAHVQRMSRRARKARRAGWKDIKLRKFLRFEKTTETKTNKQKI